MPNSYFRFKQFTIHQDRCAMKVGTDGVLLGAWTNIGEAKHILDIGTGTGLIALMLAQRSEAMIDAIEIDREAADQAAKNAKSSPWNEQIRVYHTSLQEYISSGQCYDLIVTNPPYFHNALTAPDPKRTLARHNQQLGLSELLHGVKNLLTSDGRLGIILPAEVFNIFVGLAEKAGLYPSRKTLITPSPAKSVKRILAEFSFYEIEAPQSELIIEKYSRHAYSEEYIALTKDFYLKM